MPRRRCRDERSHVGNSQRENGKRREVGQERVGNGARVCFQTKSGGG